ncbi:calcium/sodium antiporter [Loktanella sp. Alg231-35]|uniref:calcium/sodium antiporter n=1 Tax=Loktanella sp. Alg231-35 TaxID=1922220 RepID=UPI000D55ACF1|nr:calcium/sodium antiporter [Loktanella sp. Alg231-35]
MLIDVAFLITGCGLLYFGGDWLVDGIVGLARGSRIPPVLVAFVVMGFGTSAPELFVAVNATVTGTPDVAVGNVVGSNIANLLLVLGLTTLIAPLAIDKRILYMDGGAMLVAALALWAIMADGVVSRTDAFLLIGAMVSYIVLRFFTIGETEDDAPTDVQSLSGALVIGALALLALPLGAHLFVDGAIGIATSFGVSEAIIGLTVVAIGTSLPEMAACFVAALRREGNLILGGILGSNVFNGTIVIGAAALASPILIAPIFLSFWLLGMIGATILTLVFLRINFCLNRPEALVMLACYAVLFLI